MRPLQQGIHPLVGRKISSSQPPAGLGSEARGRGLLVESWVSCPARLGHRLLGCGFLAASPEFPPADPIWGELTPRNLHHVRPRRRAQSQNWSENPGLTGPSWGWTNIPLRSFCLCPVPPGCHLWLLEIQTFCRSLGEQQGGLRMNSPESPQFQSRKRRKSPF